VAYPAIPTTQFCFPPLQLWHLGLAAWCVGTIQGKDGGIQVLAGLAPPSQNITVIHEQLMKGRSEQHFHPAAKRGESCLLGGSHLGRWLLKG